MDILYIIGNGNSKCNNKELRYSLRSIDKYGKGVGRVFVAGFCPDWLSDEVVKVPFIQPYNTLTEKFSSRTGLCLKFANVLATILYVVDNTDISEEFLISMDDHFYTRPIDFEHYPFYAKGGEEQELPVVGKSPYGKVMAETREFLKRKKLPTHYLTIHRNMHCSKKIIEECREVLNECVEKTLPVEPLCYMLNYWYDKYGFEITYSKDVKVRGPQDWLSTRPSYTEVFSTADFKPMSRLDVLVNELYPKKSKYEK